MSVDIHSEDGQVIRQLIPLATMPANQFEALCQKITIETTQKDTFLFNRNDITTALIYLIDGSITLQSSTLKVETIESGTEPARFALAHQFPRKIDAITNSTVRFLRLNIDIIDDLPSASYEEEKSYMVVDETDIEEEEDSDWMTTLLKSPIFKALPPANLQQILMSLEEVSFEKGELIIKQGDPGDFYYLILKGQCLLSRKPSVNAKEIKLGLLRSQDTFGEDSLLSGGPRNVNITSLTQSKLLRLSKDKFIALIKEPSLEYVSFDALQSEAYKEAILLDVRAPDEFKIQHLPGSISAPFFSLRMQLKTFDKKNPLIIICTDGKTSEAAAFLLLRYKFNAHILKGGMNAVPEEQPTTSFEIESDIETLADNNVVSKNESELLSSSEPISEISTGREDLHLENQQLKETVTKLRAEKANLEKKYRILYKQSEKLKSVLDALKKRGS